MAYSWTGFHIFSGLSRYEWLPVVFGFRKDVAETQHSFKKGNMPPALPKCGRISSSSGCVSKRKQQQKLSTLSDGPLHHQPGKALGSLRQRRLFRSPHVVKQHRRTGGSFRNSRRPPATRPPVQSGRIARITQLSVDWHIPHSSSVWMRERKMLPPQL